MIEWDKVIIMRKVHKKNAFEYEDNLSEEKVRKWPDYILWMALLVLSCIFCYFLFQLGMLTPQLFMIICVIILVIDLILLVLILKRTKNRWSRWVMRFFLVLLCIVFGIGSFTAGNTFASLEVITSRTESKVEVDLIVPVDSTIDKVTDLAQKKVGYSTLADASTTANAMSEINTQVNEVEYVDSNDYSAMYDDLLEGKLDAMLLPALRLNMLKEGHKDLDEKIRVVQQFESVRTIAKSASSSLDISKEPFVVYVAGIDEGDDPSADGRSDVNILVMVDPTTNSMTTVAVPRDSYVPNPALNNGSDKLTHLGNNGVDNSVLGLEETFGIEIDYYAKANFQSLIHIVDALGGIDVDVKIDFTEQDENRSFKKSDVITLKKGMQHLNGKEALAYSRHRKTEGYGNTGREQAQQQIIKAIMKKLTTPEGISKVNALMDVAKDYISTDIPLASIQRFISKQLEDVKPWTVSSVTLRDGADATLTTVSMPSLPLSCYLLAPQDITKVFNAYAGMFDTSKMKDFQFDLSQDPQPKIDYQVQQETSEYVITSADADRLSPYSVYYGLGREDSSSASRSEQYAQNNNVEVIVPVWEPSYTPEPEPEPVMPVEPEPVVPVEPTPVEPEPEPEPVDPVEPTPEPTPDPGTDTDTSANTETAGE